MKLAPVLMSALSVRDILLNYASVYCSTRSYVKVLPAVPQFHCSSLLSYHPPRRKHLLPTYMSPKYLY